MIIYIAELSHIGAGRSPNVVPLAAGFLAAFAKDHFPDLKITIFRDPNLLLQAIVIEKPNIVGFSVHLWSERLSNFCAKRIKKISENIVIVVGGPSIDDIDSEILKFMKDNTFYDVCIPNDEEVGFLNLIEHIYAYGKVMRDIIIDGCSTLNSNASLLRGSYIFPELSKIQSPYLKGFLDTFLEEGYDPIIQTMRGCPYSCKFCVSGAPLWKKIRSFDKKRIFEEFDYIKKRTKSNLLILTDENFGILGKRDIEIAKYIIASYKKGDYPRRLYYYTAKNVTDSILKIVEILAPIGEFGMSFQTLDEHVRKEINRANISFEKSLRCVKWATERKTITSNELIFGFPGEKMQSYIAGIERLIKSGIDRIYSYNLRLFNGIDLATQENRNKYEFKTLFRLPERTYGYYNGEFISETEEIVVGSSSFNYIAYQKIRKYGLFLELASGREYLTELIRIMIKLELPGEKLINFLAEYKYNNYPVLFSIVSKYEEMTRKELFETSENCIANTHEIFSSGKPIPEVKLNFVYSGKIIFDYEAKKEIFDIIKEFILKYCISQKQIDFFIEYTDVILFNQIVSFSAKEELTFTIQTKIRIDRIEQNNYNSVDDLLGQDFSSVELNLYEDAINFLEKQHLSSFDNEATLQDIYMSVSRFGLLRQRKIKNLLPQK